MPKIRKYQSLLFFIYSAVFLTLVIAVAVTLEYFILAYKDRQDATATNEMLIRQTIAFLDKYTTDKNFITEELKNEYLLKARVADYILSIDPDKHNQTEDFRKIASILNVDEIHIFDEEGTIVDGTNPEYFGLSVNDGGQIGFFKPMLKDHELSLCQGLVPNTAEGKEMIYAMVRSSDGKKLVQIGISPSRFIIDRKKFEIPSLMFDFPLAPGYVIRVAKVDNGEIVASTDQSSIGYTLDDYGFEKKNVDLSEIVHDDKKVNGKKIFFSFKSYHNYVIGVFYNISVNNSAIIASLFIEFIYLSLAGIVIIIMFRRVVRAHQERDSQFSVLKSLSEIYATMHVANLESDTVVEYSSLGDQAGKVCYIKRKNASEIMLEFANDIATEDHLDGLRAFMDLSTLPDRMMGRKTIFQEFMSEQHGWFRASFIVIDSDINERPTKVLFTTQIIDEDKKKLQSLMRRSYTDEMTLCLNRRAYDRDLSQLTGSYVFVSMDVNGLKMINDTKGHVAGDELIVGASNCIKASFARYGHVYRIGGDEFIAILKLDLDHFEKLKKKFFEKISSWKGTLVPVLTISMGYIHSSEVPGGDVTKIASEADLRMYENKSQFYRKSGNDRRGGIQEATSVLSSLYIRILRLDLTIDCYSEVTNHRGEAHTIRDASDVSVSSWLAKLGDPQNIHPADMADFEKNTDLAFLRKHFSSGQRNLTVSFRWKETGENYENYVLDFVASGSYTPASQVVYAYVRILS